MKKRIIASILTVILCISLFPISLFANMQNAVRYISDNCKVSHQIIPGATEGGSGISPIVELKFLLLEPSTEVDTRAIDGSNLTHKPDYYQVHIQEYPNGQKIYAPEDPSQLRKEDVPDHLIPVHNYTRSLKNGKLYRMQVIPYHRHTYPIGDGDTETRWAPHSPNISTHPFQYILTDFDTKAKGKEASIEVTWEEIVHKDIEYTIGYVQGNYEGKTIDDIDSKKINYISSADIKKGAQSYVDASTRTNRLRYTLTAREGIAPGQMYSIFVIPSNRYIEGKDLIANRTNPKIATATTELELKVFNIGKDKIRLEWNPESHHMMDGTYELERTEIKEYATGDESGRVIAMLYGTQGTDLGYYEYREPSTNAYYQLIFYYKSRETGNQLIPQPQTPKVLYVPGQLRITPLTPQIPEPIGPSTKVTEQNKAQFLLPNDAVQVPLVDLWKNDHTFHVNQTAPPSINVVWSAYQQKMQDGSVGVDLSILYDLWITDDLALIQSESIPVVENLSFEGGMFSSDILYNANKDTIVGFKHSITEYYDSNGNKRSLVPNKIYYLKIVAKKQYGDEFQVSLPKTVAIMFGADGEIFSPPMMAKPPLQIDAMGIGKTSVTIEWLETWHEILAKDPSRYTDVKEQQRASQWNAKVYTGTTTGPAISFMNKEGTTEHILKTQKDIDRVKSIVSSQTKNTDHYNTHYIDRMVNLGKGVQYEYKFLQYAEIVDGLEKHNATVTNKIDIEQYIQQLMEKEVDPTQNYGWKKISPKTVEDEERVSWKQYTENGLKPNTSYVFLVKPYTIDYEGNKLQTALPTWIVVTTLPDAATPEGKPIVPNLSLHGKSDTTISVQWKYNSSFDYEIRYGRLDDPEKATQWPFTISSEVGQTHVPDGGNAIVTITGLFPDTSYNVWIRAKQKKGKEISAWSNPVTTKTDILGTPAAPAGLGIASYQSILEIGKDFQPVGENYITLEWQRNAQDKDLDSVDQGSQRVQKEYCYVIELADNPEFLDVHKITVTKDNVGTKENNIEVLSRQMAYFEGLIANRPYYVRAKTILVAHDTENNREIIMQSEYSEVIRIITKPSQSEYDGGDKSNQVIYPGKINQTYDGTTWTYEILDTQKVINEMVTGDQFQYVIPVEKYRGSYDPKYRVIRIPQPVISTLINRRMQLEIRTHGLTIQIPVSAIESYMRSTITDDMIEFTFETLDYSDLYSIDMGYEYQLLTAPQKMSVALKSKKGYMPITQVNALMKVNINMFNRTDYVTKNINPYTYNLAKGIWEKGNYSFDKEHMQLQYTTGTIGIYTVYELNRKQYTVATMSQSMSNVLQQYDILGIGTTYKPDMTVEVSEYIKIMLGIAENRKQIIPDGTLTATEKQKAQQSGLYVGSNNTKLTQQVAVNGLARLYELKNGMSIRSDQRVNVSSAEARYQNNIRKAYTIGLIDSIRPTATMTYDQLFELIEYVIE